MTTCFNCNGTERHLETCPLGKARSEIKIGATIIYRTELGQYAVSSAGVVSLFRDPGAAHTFALHSTPIDLGLLVVQP